jgi:hypothetical protein
MSAVTMCERCDVYERVAPATTHQEFRHVGDPEHWPNQTTDRCDKCAQALREYARLGGISTVIVVDEPLPLVWEKKPYSGVLNHYVAKGRLGTYTARKTGGRHFPWTLFLNGERVQTSTKLRSCQEIAALHDREQA